MMRIAVGGLLHETNTFAAVRTEAADFKAPSGWPPLMRGATVINDLPNYNVPAKGALKVLDSADAIAVPLIWAMALPGGPVAHSAFKALLRDLLDRLAMAGPVDGVYLDLHGAMVTTEDDDPEGTLLAEVRRQVGKDTPLVASLDPHANVSARMAETADYLTAYRTYPHTDLVATGARGMRQLLQMCVDGRRPAMAYRPVPYLLPLVAQTTDAAPMDRLMARAIIDDVTACFGFPLADVPMAGPSLIAYAPGREAADRLAETHLLHWCDAASSFCVGTWTPQDAVLRAMSVRKGVGPVILADVQDNPGAGGSNDTTGLLSALVACGAESALVVHMKDKAAVTAAHAGGLGASLDIALGGQSDAAFGAPVAGPWTVTGLGDGHFIGEGPMYRGNDIRLGPVALLERQGVSVIVAEQRMQASEPGLPRHLGIGAAAYEILVLKSSVHFRAAFGHSARDILLVAAPGRATMDLTHLTYHKAKRPPVSLNQNNEPSRTETINA